MDDDLSCFAHLKHVLTGGEALSVAHFTKFSQAYPDTPLTNLYGPTENTCLTTFIQLNQSDITCGTVPLGRAVDNSSVYVTDRSLRLLPVSVYGELVTGGDGLASGYVSRPALTAERFVPNPFASEPGERLYRTGDLVRLLPRSWREGHGIFVFAGRIDRQVKLRGFRIELNEIETVICSMPAVKQALVLARQGAAGMQLVAYVAVTGNLDPIAIQDFTRSHLPAYMVPACVVVLENFPVTATGKIDQKRLPQPELGHQHDKPAHSLSPAAQTMAGIWSKLLGIDSIGAGAHFFELGGHSLLATRLVAAIGRAFGREVSLKTIFEHPLLEDLALRVTHADQGVTSEISRDWRAQYGPDDLRAPLSYMQKRLWFIDRLEGASPAYNIPAMIWVEGYLCAQALQLSINQLIARHESLRTRFVVSSGYPEQLILPTLELAIGVIDLSRLDAADAETHYQDLAERERLGPFDLEQGPLLRVKLVRMPDQRHLLMVNQHHIISDGWSMEIFTRELAEYYGAAVTDRTPQLAPALFQYPDFAHWQQKQGDARIQEQLAWWQEKLAEMPSGHDLPTDKTRPQMLGYRGAALDFELEADSANLIRSQRVTPFMLHLAVLATLLARSAGQAGVTIGTPIANRTHAGIEDLIGFFANTLALPVQFNKSLSFAALLDQVRATVLDAFARADSPFERIVEVMKPDRSLGRSPLFQVMFTCDEARTQQATRFPGLSFAELAAQEQLAKFELNFAVTYQPDSGSARVKLIYNSDLWERSSMLALASRYQHLIQSLVALPHCPISSISLLDPSERQLLLEHWSGQAPSYPRDSNLIALFEAQVAATPEAIALVTDGQSGTYVSCNRRANQYAARMAELGLRPGQVAALCLPRGTEAVICILAILKRGACYLPLDTSFPVERIKNLCGDSHAHFLLTRRSQLAHPPITATQYLDDWDLSQQPGHNHDLVIHPLQSAYVMYTSGSTGVPMGVVVPHRAVLRLVCGTGSPMFNSDQIFTTTSSMAFDASTFDIWGALLHGARLVIFPEGGLEQLGPFLVRQRITVMWLTAQLFNVAVDTDLESMAGLRYVLTGGETLSPPHVRRFLERFPQISLHNGYGPTENTTFTACGKISEHGIEPGGVPLGSPIPNTSVYICDHNLQIVPVGIFGELVSGGDGVASGYLARPALTAEKFVPNPFAGRPGQRLYRTGDLVRWLPKYSGQSSGVLEYAGRIDRQVKLRGFRVELGEIESVLSRIAGVRQALVVPRQTAAGLQLLGYVAAEGELESSDLLAQLRSSLPAFMVPVALVVLDRFPVNNSGKLDLKRLPEAELADSAEVAQRCLTPSEARIAAVWQQLLSVATLNPTSNFFDLGGHSLLAVRLVSALNRSFDRNISMKAVFEQPTLAELAQYIDQSAVGASRTLITNSWRDGSEQPLRAPLSFTQARLYFLDRLEGASPTYNIPLSAIIQGPLCVCALQASLNGVVERHENLRTRLVSEGDYPQQIILETCPLTLTLSDLSALPAEFAEAQALGLAEREALTTFTLDGGPLLRILVLRVAPLRHLLVLNLHHIISDGWSTEILVRELAEGYGAAVESRPAHLVAPTIQYADFAHWQQLCLDKPRFQQDLLWWKQLLQNRTPGLDLPIDYPRPSTLGFGGAQVHLNLCGEGRSLLSSQRVSPFMLHLTSFAYLLSHYSGQSEVTLGTPIANRSQPELEPLIGFFANTIALPLKFEDQGSFKTLLRQTRDLALEAFSRSDTPFEKVVEAVQPDRASGRTPLFQASYSYLDGHFTPSGFPGLRFQLLTGEAPMAKYELSLFLGPCEGGYQGSLVYNRELWQHETIAALGHHYERLHEQLLQHPDQPLAHLDLLSVEERQTLLQVWNPNRVDYPRDSSIIALFEDQCQSQPDATAVYWQEYRFSYGVCNRQANRMAHWLVALGLAPGEVAAFSLPRSADALLLQIAILKCSATYAPIDAKLPVERIRTMLVSSAAKFLITLPQHSRDDLGINCHELKAEGYGAFPEINLDRAIDPLQHAYIMYTSGSTGEPKGVAISHRGVVRLAFGSYMRHQRDQVILHGASLSFDMTTLEVYCALLHGAALEILEEDSLDRVATLLRQGRITETGLTTQLFHLLVDEDLSCFAQLKHVLTGGEALSVAHFTKFSQAYPDTPLTNLYGPTENTCLTTSIQLHQGDITGGRVPLGRAVDNTSVYVTDRNLRLLPVSVYGELVTGGDGLASGYVSRPALTAERFVPNPFASEPGDRLYRTGDLVRLLPRSWRDGHGILEFAGRIDRQVKLRGFRIELGEIETVIATMQGVKQAPVLTRQGAAGMQLVAYVAASKTLEPAAVQNFIRNLLPAYMVPACVMLLESFPANANGKIDLKRLHEAVLADSAEASQRSLTPSEARIAAVWQQLLSVTTLVPTSHFFDLGGHSLLAVRLVSALNRSFDRNISMKAVFEQPTLAGLAQYIDQSAMGASTKTLITSSWRDSAEQPLRAPLSYTQARLYFLDRLEGASPTYNMPLAAWVKGPLCVRSLQAGLNRLIERHETLRSLCAPGEDFPQQVILAQLRLVLELIDLSGLDATELELRANAIAERERWLTFDLERGPLLRTRLLRLDTQRHLLVLNQHHIIGDGWSMEILFRELAECYAAAQAQRPIRLEPLEIQYADYAQWQRSQDPELLKKQLAWWQRKLEDMPSGIDLPLDKIRPSRLGFLGGQMEFQLSGSTKLLLRDHQVTPFMLHLAVLAVTLARYSGQTRITIGTPIANRTPAAVVGLIGFFANTLAVPVQLTRRTSFAALLRQVRNTALEAFAQAETPFEKIVEAIQPDRNLGRSPLFQVMFTYSEADPESRPNFPGLDFQDQIGQGIVAKFELNISVSPLPTCDSAQVNLVYNTDLWEHSSMLAFAHSYQQLYQNLVAQPHCPLQSISPLDPSERQLLLEHWSGQTPSYPHDSNLVALFEAQVAATPDAIALVADGQICDYASCNRRANQYAARMAELGLRPGQVAAFCLPRGIEAVICILAILKRGACYLPLDTNFPEERIKTLCNDSRAHFLLTRRSQLTQPPIAGTQYLEDWDLSQLQEHNPGLKIHPLQAAYVIYTSGSTGVPKGVVVPHRAVVRLVSGTGSALFHSDQTFLMTCSMAFDVSTFEIWGALLCGARLVPLPEGEIERLGAFLVAQRITVMWLTAQLFNVAVDTDLEAMAGLRYVLAGGEALSPPHVRWFLERFPQITLLNGYGPTENTTFTTCGNISELGIEPGGVPLGPPIPNTSIYITDQNLNLVPLPVFGELVSGGDGVASGYLERPALTAEKFVPNPFASQPGERLYRTGDLARWLPKYSGQARGVLEYAGRIDRQIKLRGFRIELGEIEAALSAQDGIRQALVVTRETPSGKQLVAYVTQQGVLDQEAVLAQLRKRLPAYMVPARLTLLEAFPVNNSGKLDHKRLPAPSFVQDMEAADEPLASTGRDLAQIWRALLGVEQLSPSSNFFSLGGHSLLALKLSNRIAKHFGVSLPLASFFAYPSLGAMAEQIDNQDSGAISSVVALDKRGDGQSLFLVHPIGGQVFAYRELAQLLRRPVYGFQAVGLLSEKPQASVASQASRYISDMRSIQPSGPYLLGAWSYGGLVAHEMVHQLQAVGETVNALVLVDSHLSLIGQTPEINQLYCLAAKDLARLHQAELTLEPQELAGLDEDAAFTRVMEQVSQAGFLSQQGQAQLHQFLAVYRANAHAAYRHKPSTVKTRTLLLQPEGGDPSFYSQAVELWRAQLGNELEAAPMQGDHFSCLQVENVEHLASQIETFLKELRPSVSEPV